VIIHLDIQEDW